MYSICFTSGYDAGSQDILRALHSWQISTQTKAIGCVISVLYAAWLPWFDNIFGPLDTRPLFG